MDKSITYENVKECGLFAYTLLDYFDEELTRLKKKYPNQANTRYSLLNISGSAYKFDDETVEFEYSHCGSCGTDYESLPLILFFEETREKFFADLEKEKQVKLIQQKKNKEKLKKDKEEKDLALLAKLKERYENPATANIINNGGEENDDRKRR